MGGFVGVKGSGDLVCAAYGAELAGRLEPGLVRGVRQDGTECSLCGVVGCAQKVAGARWEGVGERRDQNPSACVHVALVSLGMVVA